VTSLQRIAFAVPFAVFLGIYASAAGKHSKTAIDATAVRLSATCDS
jgi:hypothetical protein